MARFQKGNKGGPGGKRVNKGGRPTKEMLAKKAEKVEIRRLAGIMAKKMLEDSLGTVLDTYASLATGRKIGRIHRRLDAATCRDFVSKFVGMAPRTITLDVEDSIESFFEKVANRRGPVNELEGPFDDEEGSDTEGPPYKH